MEYYRYGKFRPSDYCSSWCGIILLQAFAIMCIIQKLSFALVIFPTIYAITWAWSIIAPNRERFTICDDTIVVTVGRRTRKIVIPNDLTLVVSYADICPPLAIRTGFGNQTHILKEKYAISILSQMPVDNIIETIHRNHVGQYTNSMIERCFSGYRYIYCFVYDQALLDHLISNRNCQLVVPESLVDKVSINLGALNISIDLGC